MNAFTATWQEGVLRLSGELDLSTDEDLLVAVRCEPDSAPEIILELSELRFIDSTGIRALLRIAQEAHPRRVVLRAPKPAVRRVIDLTGIEDVAAMRIDD